MSSEHCIPRPTGDAVPTTMMSVQQGRGAFQVGIILRNEGENARGGVNIAVDIMSTKSLPKPTPRMIDSPGDEDEGKR